MIGRRSRAGSASRAVAALLWAAALGGCAAQQALAPARSGPVLSEVLPRFQLACSARGLRPGSDAFGACVQERVAAWQGRSGARGDARGGLGPAEAARAKAGAPGATECRLSPLGGYDCGRR